MFDLDFACACTNDCCESPVIATVDEYFDQDLTVECLSCGKVCNCNL